jgi:heme o synthase
MTTSNEPLGCVRRLPASAPEDLVTATDPRTEIVSPTSRRSVARTVRAYVALTKPRIIETLLVTTVPTMFLAAGGLPPAWLVVATLVGGTMAAGSANTLNCYIDRDIDQVMHRTRRRPLATGEVTPREAMVFGVVLGVLSVLWLGLLVNWLASALALVANLFYVLVYTLLLKRRTPQNIVWGGAAGCMQVLIGWAAVTGSLDWPAVVFFGIVFCWQMPHFWALASRFRYDYFRAGVPMLSVVAGPVSVGRQSVGWAWGTLGVSLLMVPVTAQLGWITGLATLGLGAWYVAESIAWLNRIKAGVPDRPMRLFSVSITYMTLLSIALVADVLV